jgi:phosphatidylglycerol lysyltransferase
LPSARSPFRGGLAFGRLGLLRVAPQGKPAFLSCVGIFITAQLVGAVSHVPGGIGVFESMIMLSLSR